MKFKPLFDNVILKKVEVEEKPVTGIILSGDNKDKTELGEVIAVGSGDTKDGKIYLNGDVSADALVTALKNAGAIDSNTPVLWTK